MKASKPVWHHLHPTVQGKRKLYFSLHIHTKRHHLCVISLQTAGLQRSYSETMYYYEGLHPTVMFHRIALGNTKLVGKVKGEREGGRKVLYGSHPWI